MRPWRRRRWTELRWRKQWGQKLQIRPKAVLHHGQQAAVLKRSKAELSFRSSAEVFHHLQATMPLGAKTKLQVGSQKGSPSTMLQRPKTAVPFSAKTELSVCAETELPNGAKTELSISAKAELSIGAEAAMPKCASPAVQAGAKGE